MADYLLIVPIFLAIAVGWMLGRRDRNRQPLTAQANLSRDYFNGLDYLLSERTDEAIESFIKVLEINSDTIPAHLALAKLFRRKGDVDQAIKLHQNLLARPDLNRKDFLRIQMALARDYTAVGLLDRAENLLLEINRQNPPRETRANALRLLIKLYEKEGEWGDALDTGNILSADERADIKHELAHYSCEIAEGFISRKKYKKAQQALKQALQYDPASVRASLLQGRVALLNEQWKTAIKYFRMVAEQDQAFVSETVEPLRECYQSLGREAEFREYLEQMALAAPSTTVMLALSELVRQERGVYAAGFFVTEELKKRPSIKGFNRLIDMHIEYGSTSAKESLVILRGLTGQLEQTKPVYRCNSCGFNSRSLQWHCPSCRNWGTTKPIQGIEGE